MWIIRALIIAITVTIIAEYFNIKPYEGIWFVLIIGGTIGLNIVCELLDI